MVQMLLTLTIFVLAHPHRFRSVPYCRIFDEDGSGSIDFREFVMSLWNYCTLSKAALIMFAFDLYDNDNSGEIDIGEVELLLKEVRYGARYVNG